jgi:hypothetical protein
MGKSALLYFENMIHFLRVLTTCRLSAANLHPENYFVDLGNYHRPDGDDGHRDMPYYSYALVKKYL